MTEPRIVALVGRPNVGKSRLFNRLVHRRISIVHDQPGITRDVVSADVDGYTVMDTGGLGLAAQGDGADITRAVEMQIHLAIAAARLILFVVDVREGLTPLDEIVAQDLRKSGKEIVLVVNKVDDDRQEARGGEFARLGFGDPVHVSAEHGRGEGELRQVIQDRLGPPPAEEPFAAKRVKISFIGRPNVGKSSIGNRLLKSDRLIVTDIPGTTRDAVEVDLDYQPEKGGKWLFRLVDTAGIRHRTKISSPVEFFSITRSQKAVESSDVVFLVVDAMGGVAKQEQHLAGLVLDQGKALVIVVNKWDLVHERFRSGGVEGYESEREFRESFAEALRTQLFFNPDSPVIFVSAKEDYALERMLRAARRIDQVLDQKIPTGRLNQLLANLADKKAPPSSRGTRFRIYYAVQTGNRPFSFRLFCNRASRLPDTYKRYLQNGISREFGLDGCPVRFELVGKPKKPWDK